MEFMFDEGKATQAAGFLIRRHGSRMNYTALIKLLYLADRRSLAETGAPITGDRMVSMPHGPVLSGIYDRIREPASDGGAWHEWIALDGQYHVKLRNDPPDDRPPDDRLSRYEIATLQAVYDKHGRKTWQELRALTHRLPEWEDPHGSSLPIDPERILEAAGKQPGEIERARSEAARMTRARELLGA
jgi:uncharacterized phage-associated protein